MICPFKLSRHPQEFFTDAKIYECELSDCAWFIDVIIKDTHIRQCAIKTIAWLSVEKLTETISKGGEQNG